MTYHILIVEDNPANAFLLQELLKSFTEIQSHLATNKKEFLDAMTDRTYDLIFLDYMLPDTYGTELIKYIREKNSTIPIVMVTGKSEPYDKEVAILHGASDYIVKPIDTKKIRGVLQKFMKNVA